MYFNGMQYAKAPRNSKPQTSEGGRNIPGPLLSMRTWLPASKVTGIFNAESG